MENGDPTPDLPETSEATPPHGNEEDSSSSSEDGGPSAGDENLPDQVVPQIPSSPVDQPTSTVPEDQDEEPADEDSWSGPRRKLVHLYAALQRGEKSAIMESTCRTFRELTECVSPSGTDSESSQDDSVSEPPHNPDRAGIAKPGCSSWNVEPSTSEQFSTQEQNPESRNRLSHTTQPVNTASLSATEPSSSGLSVSYTPNTESKSNDFSENNNSTQVKYIDTLNSPLLRSLLNSQEAVPSSRSSSISKSDIEVPDIKLQSEGVASLSEYDSGDSRSFYSPESENTESDLEDNLAIGELPLSPPDVPDDTCVSIAVADSSSQSLAPMYSFILSEASQREEIKETEALSQNVCEAEISSSQSNEEPMREDASEPCDLNIHLEKGASTSNDDDAATSNLVTPVKINLDFDVKCSLEENLDESGNSTVTSSNKPGPSPKRKCPTSFAPGHSRELFPLPETETILSPTKKPKVVNEEASEQPSSTQETEEILHIESENPDASQSTEAMLTEESEDSDDICMDKPKNGI